MSVMDGEHPHDCATFLPIHLQPANVQHNVGKLLVFKRRDELLQDIDVQREHFCVLHLHSDAHVNILAHFRLHAQQESQVVPRL